MKHNIIAITPSRLQSKVWIKFDDDSLIPLKIDDVVVLGLKKFTKLDDLTLQQIYQSSLHFLLQEFALKQVAISPKTENVLLPKLKQKLHFLLQKYSYPQGDYSILINEVMDYLTSRDLLKNDQYKDNFIKKSKYKSKLEMSFLLKSKGVTFSSQDFPSDLPKIRYLVQKKIRNADISDVRFRNKLISALVRKGFALNEVKTVIDDLTSNV